MHFHVLKAVSGLDHIYPFVFGVPGTGRNGQPEQDEMRCFGAGLGCARFVKVAEVHYWKEGMQYRKKRLGRVPKTPHEAHSISPRRNKTIAGYRAGVNW